MERILLYNYLDLVIVVDPTVVSHTMDGSKTSNSLNFR